MKCIFCNAEIESDDNFCPKCGHWTAHGYDFLNDEKNIHMIQKGDIIKQNNHLAILIELLAISIVIFMLMIIIRGDDLFSPFIYIKKQINNYKYGYNTSVIKTDNKYTDENIGGYDDALNIIKKDFLQQSFACKKNAQLYLLEKEIEDNYNIPSVVFCDIPYQEAEKIKAVIDRMYLLFPNIKGALTNITITNAKEKEEYIARFQPMYQFVNIDEDINKYNKVNKTQILLNSYYFLNEDVLKATIQDKIGNEWFVEDATWESAIAHEIGHYISFNLLLKKYNLQNITFVNSENNKLIEQIINEFEDGVLQKDILNMALNNYNTKYGVNLNIEEFATTISNYAKVKDDKQEIIYDETIAEAIHDYYLHGDKMKNSSSEIITIINEKLR